MVTRLYLPYILNSDHRPIPYQYENIATRLSPSKFKVTCFRSPNISPPDSPHIDTVSLSHSQVILKRAKMVVQSLDRYDVLQTGGAPKSRYLMSQLARLRNRDLGHVHTLHIDPGRDSRNQYKQRLVNMADRVVAVSQHTADIAAERFDVDVDVIYNGIDANFFHPDRAQPDLFETFDIETPIFLFVGKLEERKRPLDVLRIAKRVPEAKFLIRGSGDLAGRVSKRANKLPNVHLLERLPKAELARLYAHIDGFVFPSVREGCPTVVLEAMASGAPVVGYRASSMPELVIDGKTGYLYEVGAINGLAEGVRKLCDSSRNTRFGMEGRKHITEHHSFEMISQEYEQMYDIITE